MKTTGLLSLLLLFAGCAGIDSRSEDSPHLRAAANSAFGGEDHFFYYVASQDPLGDQAFVERSIEEFPERPSDMATELSEIFMSGQHERIAVAGHSNVKTKRVVLDALALSEGADLRGCEVLVSCVSRDRGELESAVSEAGATFLELPMLPDRTVSEYLVTQDSGFMVMGQPPMGRHRVNLEVRKPLPPGAYLEAHFDNPANFAQPFVVVPEVDEERIILLSPESAKWKKGEAYGVRVKVFTDSTKAKLLGTHEQLSVLTVDLDFLG